MANHVVVKTRKTIKPSQLSELLQKLNSTTLKNVLRIEYYERDSQDSCWWTLTVIEDSEEYGSRACWLNSNRNFELRHGGGGDFFWWLDYLVVNTVAQEFNGTIVDEGGGGKQPPNLKYLTFLDWYVELNQNLLETGVEFIKQVINLNNKVIPPSHQFTYAELVGKERHES